MRFNEVAKPEVIYELEKWAKTQVPLLESSTSAEKLSKTILQKAITKFKKQRRTIRRKESGDGRLYGSTRSDVEQRRANSRKIYATKILRFLSCPIQD